MPERVTAIIGAGPAGLTAAYVLSQAGQKVLVLEADPERVGGISRTVDYKGFLFDVGGHRFFSKSAEIEALWDEILPGGDMLTCDRLSRILYRGHFYSYPLKATEALQNLGLRESVLCLLSYAKARMSPVLPAANFEDWVSNEFGARLFRIFFKTYTEKVWGTSCREISADWAAQRIKGLNLGAAILSSLRPGSGGNDPGAAKTLNRSFRYPRKGPGMLWARCADRIRAGGGEVRMGHRVTGCHFEPEPGRWTITCELPGGRRANVEATDLISTAPLRELVALLSPAVPEACLAAANRLKYRDFILVALILKERRPLYDQWIYVHDPSARVGRIQNFKAWSPDMVPDRDLACYGMEYFCFEEGDELWARDDGALIELAKSELQALGLAESGDVTDGCVVRQRKAYPVYDEGYAANVAQIRAELEERFPSLHLAGRNGMHKYNNQDHSMMTAMLSAKNILACERIYDPWLVNEDAEYHEAGKAGEAARIASPIFSERPPSSPAT